MKFNIFTFGLVLFSNIIIQAQTYLYPIDQIDPSNVLVMYQKNSDDLELYIWNNQTTMAIKELSSMYAPVHVKLLPSKSGYSFLDRGRIKIKKFNKRAPKSLDIYEAICDIRSLQWITDTQCFFSAKYKENYKIFMYDTEFQGGTLYSLSPLFDGCDYTFPQKIDDFLFCIIACETGKTLSESYDIVKLEFKPIRFSESFDKAQKKQVFSTNLYKRKDHPLCFLTMISATCGFVIELLHKDFNQQEFNLICNKLDLNKTPQEFLQPLFEFSLPQNMLIGYEPSRLHESIYPLLPRYYNDTVYFTSYNSDTKSCQMYRHELSALFNTKKLIGSNTLLGQNQHCFAPLIGSNNQIYFGYALNNALNVDINTGVMYCNFPSIPLF